MTEYECSIHLPMYNYYIYLLSNWLYGCLSIWIYQTCLDLDQIDIIPVGSLTDEDMYAAMIGVDTAAVRALSSSLHMVAFANIT